MTNLSVVACLAAVGMIAQYGCTDFRSRNRGATSQTEVPQSETARVARHAGIESYAKVVDLAAAAVVTIRSERRARAPRQFPFGGDPFFRDFFGGRTPGNERGGVQRGLGSGVIVRGDGYCVTNHHVVDGAEKISIEFADGRIYQAKLVGSDAPSDLAVLKIDLKGLNLLAPGNSDGVRVGDVVLAIGNPLGVGQTVTSGIVSAKGRTTGISDGTFEDFLQTDASINQGNSGGALVNTAGELIGINSQILSPSGGNIGIGFAIPSNMVRDVMDQLIKNGEVRRGQLGVVIQRVTPELASAFGLKDSKGVLISDLQRGSAAERAGLQRGDVVIRINGNPVETTNQLRNRISSIQPGSQVSLTLIREKQEREIKATLEEFKSARANTPGDGQSARPSGDEKLGASIQPLTPQSAKELGLADGASGILIRDVDPAGPAANAGIVPGDVITQVNRKPVTAVSGLASALNAANGQSILLLINRRGRTFFTSVQPN